MAKHSNGVSLKNRAAGPDRYRRDLGDGGKRYLRRRVRFMIKKLDQKEKW